jgi:hypothetical protein
VRRYVPSDAISENNDIQRHRPKDIESPRNQKTQKTNKRPLQPNKKATKRNGIQNAEGSKKELKTGLFSAHTKEKMIERQLTKPFSGRGVGACQARGDVLYPRPWPASADGRR